MLHPSYREGGLRHLCRGPDGDVSSCVARHLTGKGTKCSETAVRCLARMGWCWRTLGGRGDRRSGGLDHGCSWCGRSGGLDHGCWCGRSGGLDHGCWCGRSDGQWRAGLGAVGSHSFNRAAERPIADAAIATASAGSDCRAHLAVKADGPSPGGCGFGGRRRLRHDLGNDRRRWGHLNCGRRGRHDYRCCGRASGTHLLTATVGERPIAHAAVPRACAARLSVTKRPVDTNGPSPAVAFIGRGG